MKSKIFKVLLYLFIGIVTLGIIVYAFSKLSTMTREGEFRKYEEGLTIEVKNSSDQNVGNIRFLFSYVEDKEIGAMEELKPGKKSILTRNKDFYKTGEDLSLVMEYTLENGQKKRENLLYLYTQTPEKVVAVIDITKIDDNGNISFDLKGFNGYTKFKNE